MRLGGQDRERPGGPGFPVGQPPNGISPESGLPLALLGAGVLAALVFVMGIANVEITEYGLNYSLITRKVEPKTYVPGRYWIGPWNQFIRFPSVLTTIQFSDMQSEAEKGIRGERQLRSRTRDGLDVRIELSFQYQLAPDKLYGLYTLLGGWPDYHNTFVRLAIDRLTESATQFSATEFFVERTRIGKSMEKQLLEDFEARLSSTIFSFQLRTVSLPQEFEDAIQETEVMKQDVRVAQAEQNSTHVSLETELMQAKRRTQVAANRAEGQAQTVLLQNAADISQYMAAQEKSADSYEAVMEQLDKSPEGLLEYVQIRALRDHPSARTMVGMHLAE